MKRTVTDLLTPKEEELMQLLWENGPILISKLLELYPEPKPHFNTISTVMRRLEKKGFVGHNQVAGSFHYYAIARKEEFRNHSFGNFVKNYLGGSYFGAVSEIVPEGRSSAEELKALIKLVEKKGK